MFSPCLLLGKCVKCLTTASTFQDGNGLVSMAELKEIMLTNGGNPEALSVAECEELFAQLDKNKDGMLELSEITNYLKGR